MNPTFEPEWLEPGMHVSMLGSAEISREAAERFDVAIAQGTGGLRLPETDRIKSEIGHSPMAYIAGTEDQMERLPPKNPGLGFSGEFPDYCDLVSGHAPGRQNEEQISFYRNVGNQGLQFSSVGGLVYRKAREAGLGRVVPTEWFLQDIRD